MQSKIYSNNIYGEYITYAVNNVFEAIYVLKHSSRIEKYSSINNDKLSKRYIDIYKDDYKKTKDLNDLFLKYKIQFIENNESSKKVNLHPKFSYITFQNNKWIPLIFTNEQNCGTIETPINTNIDDCNIADNTEDIVETIIEEDKHIEKEDNIDNECIDNVTKAFTQPMHIKDINFKLKRKLIKSCIKNNPKIAKRILTYCL